jgi:glycosyltransferase involved in cell wall biosynthesis|tara:strand:+ start:4933 stop:6057 length:1125 start_codon:yes stop_codon:yes gene_type:complete
MSPKQKVIVLVSNDLYTDQRVHKVCTFLYENAFEVTLLGRKLENSQAITGRPYETRRFKLPFTKGPLFYAFLNLRFFFYLLFHKCDIILANDLDTLLAASWAKKFKRKCEIVYDSHEYYTGVPELVARPKVQKIWERIEGKIFPKLDKIYTVNQSIADLYEARYGKKLYVVRNVSPLLGVLKLLEPSDYGISENKKIILMQGAGINVDRGAEEAVEAMHEIENAVLVFIGDGDVVPQLKTYVHENRLDRKVYFLGKKPYMEMMQFTRLANIGLTLDKGTNINYQNSLPNKLFDYIQGGTPILATDIKEVKSIVEEYEIGEIITDLNPKNLAEKLKKMLENEEKLRFYAQNCLKTAQILNWEHECKVLEKIYLEN